MTEQAQAHFRVQGRVQGVGFRRFVERTAAAQSLAGWVRNCPDGSVEVAASGDAAGVAALRAAVRHGPPGAIVLDLIDLAQLAAEQLPTPFAIRRS